MIIFYLVCFFPPSLLCFFLFIFCKIPQIILSFLMYMVAKSVTILASLLWMHSNLSKSNIKLPIFSLFKAVFLFKVQSSPLDFPLFFLLPPHRMHFSLFEGIQELSSSLLSSNALCRPHIHSFNRSLLGAYCREGLVQIAGDTQEWWKQTNVSAFVELTH